jgi:2-dehydropantoate 2-reductase
MGEQSEFNPRRFAVVGAGPVGCIVAAFLARGGNEVILCDVVSDLVKPATEAGIVLEGAENFRQPVSLAVTSVDDLADLSPEVIFITVKASATPLIASAVESFHRQGVYLVSWQNGIDTELALADHLPKTAVLRAVVNYGCGLIAPCHVKLPFHHPPHYIQALDSASRTVSGELANRLTGCGLLTENTDDIVSMVWQKTIMNASMNPVCAVTGYTMSQAMNDPLVYELVDGLVKECIGVARANEIRLGWNYYVHAMEYMRNAGDHKPSMLMDIEKNRRTEVDFMNGKFIDYGQRAGVKTPFNTMIRNLVKAIEPK